MRTDCRSRFTPFVHRFFPPASTTPPSPAQTSASLSPTPHKKSLPKPHLAAGYGGTQLQAALAVAVGPVVSHLIPVSALQCVGRIARQRGQRLTNAKSTSPASRLCPIKRAAEFGEIKGK